MKKRIAVIGLGQIGGSIVLSLRKRRAPFHITGMDIRKRPVRMLSPYLDEEATGPVQTLHADLVVLCLHFSEIMKYLKGAPRDLPIVDVCSGKEEIVKFANSRKLRFIGGHPMAGNERKGENAWDKDLFDEAVFFLCPGRFARDQDLRLVRRLVRRLGAKPVQVKPSDHDRFLAQTSHFPALLSRLLMDFAKGIPSEFRGPGFHSMIRLAQTSPELMNTFLQSNHRHIRKSVADFRDRLDRWLADS